MRAFWPLFERQTARLGATLLLSLLTMLAGVCALGLSGWLTASSAVVGPSSGAMIAGTGAMIGLLSMVRVLSRYGEKVVGHDATLRLLSDLRRWLFEKLFPILPAAAGRFGRADLVGRLTADVDSLNTIFLVALGPISTAAATGVTMSVILAMVLPGGALAYACSFVVAALVVPVGLVWTSRRAGRDLVAANAGLRTTVLDSLDGHRDLVLFDRVGWAEERVNESSALVSRVRRRLALNGTSASAAVQASNGIAVVGILSAGVPAVRGGLIAAPIMVGLVLAVIASFEACAVLVRSSNRLAEAIAAAERLNALAEHAPALPEPASVAVPPSGSKLEIVGISYGPDSKRPVLRDLGMTLDRGATAIVGRSGAGKSTLAKLLVRLVDPQTGSIRLNGIDLRRIPSELLKQRVALMTQDAPVFLDTVRNNLLIGRPRAADEDLWGVLKEVRLDELVSNFTEGLDHFLGEAGQSLSVGQARRLCLARTLLSPADVIVLDEPTSGLDPEVEQEILALLPELAGNRTLVVITHADISSANYAHVVEIVAGATANATRM